MTDTGTTRLICFHHAGGTSAAFRALTRALEPDIPVTAVNLPGRESRFREPRHRDVYACATQLAEELSPLLNQPHVLLGHSMGAIIAYTVAQQRIAAFRRGPDALIVVGCAAPHLPSRAAQINSVDDLQLATTLSQFGGLPAEILLRPEWRAAVMPLVRDDLRICASHRDRGEPPLPCPIHIFGGDADPLVTRADLAGWRLHTSQPRPETIVPGGHFLFGDPNPGLVGAIAAILGAESAIKPPAHRQHRSLPMARKPLSHMTSRDTYRQTPIQVVHYSGRLPDSASRMRYENTNRPHIEETK